MYPVVHVSRSRVDLTIHLAYRSIALVITDCNQNQQKSVSVDFTAPSAGLGDFLAEILDSTDYNGVKQYSHGDTTFNVRYTSPEKFFLALAKKAGKVTTLVTIELHRVELDKIASVFRSWNTRFFSFSIGKPNIDVAFMVSFGPLSMAFRLDDLRLNRMAEFELLGYPLQMLLAMDDVLTNSKLPNRTVPFSIRTDKGLARCVIHDKRHEPREKCFLFCWEFDWESEFDIGPNALSVLAECISELRTRVASFWIA